MSAIRRFMEQHFLHFNAREALAAARAYDEHIQAGGKMLVSLAGAMSTGELGVILARMIRAGKVHAISCTGANLEEDLFNLLARKEYEVVSDWRALSAADEKALYERGMNRVTDTCIPEDVMRHLERRLGDRWAAAARDGVRKFPFEFMYSVLDDPDLARHFQVDPARSWLLAAKEAGLPVYSPGWEDSTMGNMFSANVKLGRHRPPPMCQDGYGTVPPPHGLVPGQQRREGGQALRGVLPDRRGDRGRLRDLRRAKHHPGSSAGNAVLGVLLPDNRCRRFLWRLFGGRSRTRRSPGGSWTWAPRSSW